MRPDLVEAAETICLGIRKVGWKPHSGQAFRRFTTRLSIFMKGEQDIRREILNEILWNRSLRRHRCDAISLG